MSSLFRISGVFFGLLVLLVSGQVSAYDEDTPALLLKSRFRQIQQGDGAALNGITVYLESHDKDGDKQGEVYGVLNHDFDTVRQALVQAQNWCDIVPQHLNIKVCTWQPVNGETLLTFYSGRKFYEPPENTFKLNYLYKLAGDATDYFRITLTADKGPLGTRNYLIAVEATPLSENSCLVHFSYAYQQGLIADLAMAGYFATLGSDKIGFSKTGIDENGKPVYVSGVRGALERNAIRYFLALQTYIETRNQQADKRFITSAEKWFDSTEQYHAQLYEMPKKEYLEYKEKERADQLRLQQELDEKNGQEAARETMMKN